MMNCKHCLHKAHAGGMCLYPMDKRGARCGCDDSPQASGRQGMVLDSPIGLVDDSAEEIVISGPYNVFCNKCRQHHPKAWACAFWVQLNRIDEERRN